MAIGKMLAKAATKTNKNIGGVAAAGAVAGVGGAGIAAKKKDDAKKPAKKEAPKKYNSGGDVKTGYDKGIRARTVMSDAVRRRMEESGLEEAMLTKPKLTKTTGAAETSQYAGKKLQLTAERKAKQEAERKRLMAKQAALD